MTNFQLIVGLGNPGAEYQKTRHNAGFWFTEQLTNQTFQLNTRFKALMSEVSCHGESALLCLPQTYMNKSGESVQAIARFYKIPPTHILVVHDELDLSPGTIRLKQGGGHGGHNGLKSIIAHLGLADFVRLRIGIGHPGHAADVSNFVLKKALFHEQIAIDQAINRALALRDKLLAGNIADVMNALHQKPPTFS